MAFYVFMTKAFLIDMFLSIHSFGHLAALGTSPIAFSFGGLHFQVLYGLITFHLKSDNDSFERAAL